MNKSELIEAIAASADIPKAAASRALDAMVETVTDSLKKGDSVSLVGFGTFQVKERAARTGRNPQTGQPIEIVSRTGARHPAHRIAIALDTKKNAPVILSPGHGDALPFEHRLNAGQMGPRGNVVASRLAREADVILALGTRLGSQGLCPLYAGLGPRQDGLGR